MNRMWQFVLGLRVSVMDKLYASHAYASTFIEIAWGMDNSIPHLFHGPGHNLGPLFICWPCWLAGQGENGLRIASNGFLQM